LNTVVVRHVDFTVEVDRPKKEHLLTESLTIEMMKEDGMRAESKTPTVRPGSIANY